MRRKFEVTVKYSFERTINVWAEDDQAAMERAEEIVGSWNNVVAVDACAAEPVEDD